MSRAVPGTRDTRVDKAGTLSALTTNNLVVIPFQDGHLAT